MRPGMLSLIPSTRVVGSVRHIGNMCKWPTRRGLLCRGMATDSTDVLVVGGGHNGLVAATLLARQGLQVTVLEEKAAVGGACKTEYPYDKVPGLGASTGAYLLGLMPPELIKVLGIQVPLLQRDPYYFLPSTGERYLLFGSDELSMKDQTLRYFSQQDWDAILKLQGNFSEMMLIGKFYTQQNLDWLPQEEMRIFRDDVGQTWLKEPKPIEEIAELYVRKSHRKAFVDLCRGSAYDYLNKFGFKSDLIKAMYAATDGIVGVTGNFDTPGSGMNFLVHNMTRLPGSQGTWMVVEGGMGTVTQAIAKQALKAGAKIMTGNPVEAILMTDGAAHGAVIQGGKEILASVVVVNADPFRMRDLVGGKGVFPSDFDEKLDLMMRDGHSLKLNFALRDLPKFTCLDSPNVYRGTIHILPEGPDIWENIRTSFRECSQGKLPQRPCIEWYTHTVVDPSLQDKDGHHSAALFVDSVPYELANSTWDEEKDKYSDHLLSILDDFAPGTSELVVDTFSLPPVEIERHFGISKGHIHHVDNTFGYSDRFPYATPIPGLYSCSAGTHPAGSVIGCAGHNCALRVAKDLGISADWHISES